MARVIKYIPKATTAKTEYIEISPEDLIYLKADLIKWMARICELDLTRNEDLVAIRDQYFHKRRKSLPKGREGENTPSSFIGGLINNIVYGEQRDLTMKQVEAIENISSVVSQVWDDCEPYRFQIGVLF